MNKFKVFFTAAALIWLWGCGFWAIFRWFATGEVAWLGLLVNAWALPLWMLLRHQWPGKYVGGQREPPAFAAVLAGLAVTLLTDTEKGPPVYLAIYNLFIFLVYLFHLSALRHPDMPAVGSAFPELVTADGRAWYAAEHLRRNNLEGLLLIFLRGSFCAGSRALLAQLPLLLPDLQRCKVGLVLFSTQDGSKWQCIKMGRSWMEIQQLAVGATANRLFVATGGAPPLLRPGLAGAARPSQWLLDSEAFVLWRHLPVNYRTPGSAELLRSQLFRLEE